MDSRFASCIARLADPSAPMPSAAEWEAFAAQWDWFLPPRIARAHTAGASPEGTPAEEGAGGGEPLWQIVAPWRSGSTLCMEAPEAEAFTAYSAEDLIERFLGEENLRIVAPDDEAAWPEMQVRTEAELDDDEEFVSEDLAEIYRAQGLNEQAIAIYRQLSLRNPEKSVYFAELISALEQKNK